MVKTPASAIRIAIDGMGGDHAPGAVVEAVIRIAREYPGIHPILVGDQAALRLELTRLGARDLKLEIVHAEQSVGMAEGGADSFRKKRDSSMAVATRLVREGRAAGVFSAGNTGAMVAASLLNIGRLEGVHRPALATPIPTSGDVPWAIILDVGATADCKPANLLQFAHFGEIYFRKLYQVEHPKVGLLNIGEESSKGSELAQEAYKLLEKTNLNFVGNVEGRDVLGGTVDVVVTDGFTGNIMLKFAESVWAWSMAIVRREVGEHLLAKVGALLLKPSIRRMRKRMDYSEYGGAPLLGIDGVSMVGHGHSDPTAIVNGIRFAADLHASGILGEIRDTLSQAGGEIVEST